MFIYIIRNVEMSEESFNTLLFLSFFEGRKDIEMKKRLFLSLMAIAASLFICTTFSYALLLGTHDGNIKEKELFDVVNKYIENPLEPPDEPLPLISEEMYFTNKVEMEGDHKTWKFDDLKGVDYLLIKYGDRTDVIWVGDTDGPYTWIPETETLAALTEKDKDNTGGMSQYVTISPVPEPATIALMAFGLWGLYLGRRKTFKK